MGLAAAKIATSSDADCCTQATISLAATAAMIKQSAVAYNSVCASMQARTTDTRLGGYRLAGWASPEVSTISKSSGDGTATESARKKARTPAA